jgi:C4-type Zn-finger protein
MAIDRTKECPLCGETMHLKIHEAIDRIPGQSQVVKRTTREWLCNECEYFEDYEFEAEPDDTQA